MRGKLLGWLPTLAIVAIVAIALFLSAWKSAAMLLAPAIVSAPIPWNIPGLRFLSAEGMEKGAICLMLSVVGAVSLGLETSKGQDTAQKARQHQASQDESSSDESSDDDSAETSEEPGDGAAGTSASAAVSAQARAATFRLAAERARGCDVAHLAAAGAVRKLSEKEPSAETRAAVAAAVQICEASWIMFNRPELRGDPASVMDGEDSEAMRACDQGYLGRWLTNDDLLGVMDKGLPPKEISRIERRNSANDKSVSTCAGMLKQVKPQSS